MQAINNDKFDVTYKYINNLLYFKARDIAMILGYSNVNKSIQQHIDDDYKFKLRDIPIDPVLGEMDVNKTDNSIYVSEPGLYQFIFKSQLPVAKEFSKWVYEEVLPSIRSQGTYIPVVIQKQVILKNETDLHYKVVEFIRNHFPHVILIAGLGEHQRTSGMRVDAFRKGYTAGQPDILILNLHKNTMAIELKSPSGLGVSTEKQNKYLDTLKHQNYNVLISSDYDIIIIQLIKYFEDIRIQCKYCKKRFKNEKKLMIHCNINHISG